MKEHLISFMIGFPFLGAVLQAVNRKFSSAIALVASLASSLCGFALVSTMSASVDGGQHVEKIAWVGSYSILYEVALDGIGAPLVLLVSILFPVLMASEWPSEQAESEREARGIHGLLLLLQSMLVGAICAQNLFLIFFFWAATALPPYFLLSVWGDRDREKAAFRSLIAATVGNAFFFMVLLLVYSVSDPHSFSLSELSGGRLSATTMQIGPWNVAIPALAFLFLCLGFAFRIPLWPVHGWFSYLSTQAPASVCIAWVAGLVPVSLMVFLRLSYALFPAESMASSGALLVFGGINVLFGAIGAVAQTELRRFLAFFCIAQVGLVLMGIGVFDSAALVGVVYLLMAGGLALAGFGLLIGIIRRRTGHAQIFNETGQPALGGVAGSAPELTLFAAGVFAAMLGVPGLGGFVGQSLITLGGYSVEPSTVLVVAVGSILLTYALFSVFRAVFFGPSSDTAENSRRSVRDLTWRERAVLVPVLVGLLASGLYPKPLMDLVKPSAEALLTVVTGKKSVMESTGPSPSDVPETVAPQESHQ